MSLAVEINCEQVETLAGQGLTTKQIADCIGIGRTTLYEHRKKDPNIEDAIKRGRSKGVQQVTNALFSSAMTGNVTAQIFYLKNRDPDKWRDRRENALTGPDGGPVKHIVTVTLVGKDDPKEGDDG